MSSLVAEMSKMILSKACRSTLSKRNFARLSRFLWLQSRFDVANDMARNGELLVQDAVIRHIDRTGHGVVFDVGTHLGRWSERLLEKYTGPHLEIRAFEPSVDARARLEDNLAEELRRRDVQVESCVVTDQSGRPPLHQRSVIRDQFTGHHFEQSLSKATRGSMYHRRRILLGARN